VNKNIKPKQNNSGVFKIKCPLYKVANQLKIFTPVGTAIIIVAAVKYARVSTSNPTVNIWWAQTINPNKPIPFIA
jgi:phage FluMu protein Com